jgi:hypothetical protein
MSGCGERNESDDICGVTKMGDGPYLCRACRAEAEVERMRDAQVSHWCENCEETQQQNIKLRERLDGAMRLLEIADSVIGNIFDDLQWQDDYTEWRDKP